MKKGIGLVLAICLLLALASPSLAGGLKVSGGKIEASVGAGNQYSYSMKVENTSGEPMDIGVEIKGYGVLSNRAFIALEAEEDNSPYTARELLAVSPTTFHLEPGDSQVITVIAEIPSEIGDGGRYAIVFIHTAPKGEMVATITAIAARVLLTIDGSNLIHESEVTEVSLGDVTSGEPVEALVTVANKGNHHYKPRISGTLRSGDKIVATTSVEADWPIIPGYTRQFKLSFTSSELVTTEEYEVEIEVRDDAGKMVAEYPNVEKQEVPEQPPAGKPGPVLPAEQPAGEKPAKEGPPPPAEAQPINWPILGVIGSGVIISALLIYFLAVKRRGY